MKKLIYSYFYIFLLPFFGYSQTVQKTTTPLAAVPPAGTLYVDNDCDGIGSSTVAVLIDVELCYSTTTGDCDDNNTSIGTSTWYLDNDNDGFGNPNITSCTLLPNYVSNGDDCADNNASLYPKLWYADADGDGFGNPLDTKYGCFGFGGYVDNNTDCNDADSLINPNTKWYFDPTGTGVFDDNELYDAESGIEIIIQCGPPGPNYTTAHSSSLYNDFHWVQTIDYDNKGIANGASRTYFDDLGKPNLSLSKDFVSGIIWGSETTYDSFGRPDKSSFIAPSSLTNLGKIGYLTSSPFYSSTNNLTNYYSDSNTIEPYQAKASHPYSQTNYDVLNPGNVVSVIGGNQIDDGWKTGFSYTFPAAQEMYYLFGYNFFNGPLIGTTEEIQTQFFKTISIDANGVENVVFTDGEGKTLASARSGTSNISAYDVFSLIGTQGFVDVHIPVGAPNATFTTGTIPANYVVYNLKTGLLVTPTPTSLASGAYRIALAPSVALPTTDPKVFVTNVATGGVLSTSTGAYGIKYKVNYYDFAINVYDKTNRLTKSIQPNGFKANFTATTATFKILASPTYLTSANYATSYLYNTLGQVVQVSNPDEGTSKFAYRKDGQIRYSQNANQTPTKVSYTNYDSYGRPIESGVITGTSTIWTTALDSVDNNAVIAGTPSERVFSVYDDTNNVSSTPTSTIPTPYSLLINTSLSLSTLTSGYTTPYTQKNLSGNVAVTYKADSGTTINAITWYSYDIYGRSEWIAQYNDGFILGNQVKTIDYEYDYKGNVSKVLYQKNNPAELFVHKYTYDTNDVISKVETSKDNSNFFNHAEYDYYKTGELKRVDIGQGAQGLDYVYTLGGMLKSINHPSLESIKDPGKDNVVGSINQNVAPDIFGIQLDYYKNDYTRSGTNISTIDNVAGANQDFNGNIKASIWANKALDATDTFHPFTPVSATNTVTKKGYLYNYNRDNWLSNATFGSIILGNAITPENKYYEGNLNYDSNGNISSLQRRSDITTVYSDNLSYNYETSTGKNRLNFIKENAPSTADPNDIEDQLASNYIYDAIGQLTKNNKETLEYSYNSQGLVTDVRKAGNLMVKFYYNERGNRIKKESFVGASLSSTSYYVYDLSGNVMSNYYKLSSSSTISQTELPIYGLSRLGVYVKNGTSDYANYEITDHLGNVRAVVRKVFNTGAINVNSFADYYPFGEHLPFRNSMNGYKYAFQGQELDGETGMEAFQLRLWDGRIGRWLSPDPAGQYFSPYLGMGNNPINGIDSDGAFWEELGNWLSGNGWKTTSQLYINIPSKNNGTGMVGGIQGGKESNWLQDLRNDNMLKRLADDNMLKRLQDDNMLKRLADDNMLKRLADDNMLQRATNITSAWVDENIRPHFQVPEEYRLFQEQLREFTSEQLTPIYTVYGELRQFGSSSVPLRFGGAFKAAKGVYNLLDDAADLVKLNGGKNSVTIETVTQQIRYDLAGKAHGGVPTPHMQVYNKNFVNGVQKSVSRASKEAIPMTKKEMDIVRKFLNGK
ncbi:RHS repeat-associated core domain-containing protein [Flavobacterium sp.]|uniref:RHS repeat-associated core domain-containing protein n=1 Tax=Flavobacterium sp. TaxID=239 RepID=UPI002609B9D7|nr:RHS repeat-associated core domain-containing protein [Flavobacterium sp.]